VSERLFEVVEVAEPTKGEATYEHRLHDRQRLLLAQGVHPATGRPLLTTGQTCGDCVNFYRRSDRYFKCSLVPMTFGPLTDIRKGWPACSLFAGKELMPLT
jgi:hypothetical protein